MSKSQADAQLFAIKSNNQSISVSRASSVSSSENSYAQRDSYTEAEMKRAIMTDELSQNRFDFDLNQESTERRKQRKKNNIQRMKSDSAMCHWNKPKSCNCGNCDQCYLNVKKKVFRKMKTDAISAKDSRSSRRRRKLDKINHASKSSAAKDKTEIGRICRK